MKTKRQMQREISFELRQDLLLKASEDLNEYMLRFYDDDFAEKCCNEIYKRYIERAY